MSLSKHYLVWKNSIDLVFSFGFFKNLSVSYFAHETLARYDHLEYQMVKWMALKRAVLVGQSPQMNLLCRFLCFLGKKHSLDVGQDTALSNGHAGEEFVQLLVIADSQLQVPGDDPALLVVTGCVTCQLQHLSGEVFHDRCQIHWGTSANSLCIVSLPQVAMDTSNGELETSTRAPGLTLSLSFSSLATARHVDSLSVTAKLMLPRARRRYLYCEPGRLCKLTLPRA